MSALYAVPDEPEWLDDDRDLDEPDEVDGVDLAKAAAELEALTARRDPPDPADVEHDRERLRKLDADAAETRRRIREDAERLGLEMFRDYGEDVTPGAFAEPEDRGTATLSDLGKVEYVEDLIRPGRIAVVAAEEGAGKSFAIGGELAIRVAVAGGSFAGTWKVLQTGPVLDMSEMHADDDYGREETVLASLKLDRSALVGRYYRLPLMTAAGGRPALTVPEWRSWVTGWLRDHGALMLIVDTATGATMVDPWGKAIHEVYAALRVMLDEYPELAIVLLIHLKKPQGRGERRITDVLGDWGKWNDVTILMENDGNALTRARVTVRKRVRHQRRIVVTKDGGLLVDPQNIDETKGTKVPPEKVLAAVIATPGMTYAQLGAALGVTKNTASGYVAALGEKVRVVAGTVKGGPRAATRVYPIDQSINTGQQAQLIDTSSMETAEEGEDRSIDQRPYREGVDLIDRPTSAPDALSLARDVWGDELEEPES